MSKLPAMGFRYRKGMKILPGLRLNLTKNGPNSLTIGGKGFTFNLGKKGYRTTIGAPGTGLSNSEYTPYEGKPANQNATQSRSINLWPILFAIACIAYAIYTAK